MRLRILHLASYDRWTGAIAPAFTEVEALREAGVDARFAFVGGYKLERKIGSLPFVHPCIGRSQNPVAFLRSASAIAHLVQAESIEIIHAHLSFDHWLALFARRKLAARIVRTFHARRALHRDPLTRALIARTGGLAVVNPALLTEPPLRDRRVIITPSPVNHRVFHTGGKDARRSHGIEPAAPVVGVIGKITPGRGFDEALHVFAAIAREIPDARFLVVGRGFHRASLELEASHLGIGERIVWAGYHEDDLADHYRAMDLMLVIATGSDQGHRAVSEAMACGTPVVSFPIPGVGALMGALASRLVVGREDESMLASTAIDLIRSGEAKELRPLVAAATERFGLGPAAARLIDLYREVLAGE
ncbi:MAG TPA: glycosyltransferase family 4 protein [Thermoanaerobaculia bacterium]|nr:glycosyltransferase family 4 protein [Thermoanaerobaculia bacterium]